MWHRSRWRVETVRELRLQVASPVPHQPHLASRIKTKQEELGFMNCLLSTRHLLALNRWGNCSLSVIKPGFTARRVRCQSVSSVPACLLLNRVRLGERLGAGCNGLLVAVLGTRFLFPKCFGSPYESECDSVCVCVCVCVTETEKVEHTWVFLSFHNNG